jgi:hypothetical protein
MPRNTQTLNQFIEARELSEALLMKMTEEESGTFRPRHGDEQADEAFRDVAAALGYRVEKVEAPAVTEAA